MGLNTDEILSQYNKTIEQVGDINCKLNDYSAKVEKSLHENNNLSKELKANLDKALLEQATLQASVRDLEQIVAKNSSRPNSTNAFKTLADAIFADNNFKTGFEPLAQSKVGKLSTTINASITSFPADGEINLVEPHKKQFIQNLNPELTIKDLLGYGKTSSNTVPYIYQGKMENNAKNVNEGEQKPTSKLNFSEDGFQVDTFAHLMHTSVQALDDIPLIKSIINTEMLQGLKEVEEQALLYGMGKVKGIMANANDFDVGKYGSLLANPSKIDILRLAILQSSLSLLNPDAILLNSLDWTLIELEKTNDGAYIFTNPQGVATKTLWGRRVVESFNIKEGEFLIGNFKQGATYWDRQQFTLKMSTESGDNFEKNMVTFRAENRFALSYNNFETFVKGTVSNIPSSRTAKKA